MSLSSINRQGSATSYLTAVQNLQSQQASLTNLQNELSSGKKINSPSDDPAGAAAAERALTRLSRISADQAAVNTENDSITQAESTLGSVNSVLQNIRTLVVNAGDTSQTAADRATITEQISGLRDQVFALANSKDSNGMPLFGGLGSATTPFVGPNSTAPDYVYNGLPGTGTSTTTNIPGRIDGAAAFMSQPATNGVYNVNVTNTTTGSIPSSRSLTTSGITVTNSTLVNGSAYTVSVTGVDSTTVPGTTTVTYDIAENPNVGGPYTGITASYPSSQTGNFTITAMPGLSLSVTGTPAVGDTLSVTPSSSLFTTLDTAITNISKAATPNDVAQAVAQALGNIDLGLAQVSAARGTAGILMNRATAITNANSANTLQQQTDMSNVQDVDLVSTISAFQNQQTSYSAALQSYAQIQKLSLFNYITGG